MSELIGSCFKLRSWQNGDEITMLTYAKNPKVSAYLTNAFPSPYTAANARFWIDMQLQQQQSSFNLVLC